MPKFPWSKEIRSYYTNHADFSAMVHVFTGMGVAWLISLAAFLKPLCLSEVTSS